MPWNMDNERLGVVTEEEHYEMLAEQRDRLRDDCEDPECESCGRNGDTFYCAELNCQNAAHRACSPRCVACGKQVCSDHVQRIGEAQEPHCPRCAYEVPIPVYLQHMRRLKAPTKAWVIGRGAGTEHPMGSSRDMIEAEYDLTREELATWKANRKKEHSNAFSAFDKTLCSACTAVRIAEERESYEGAKAI